MVTLDTLRDTLTAAVGAGATAAGGAVVGAPAWLVALGQAIAVGFIVLRGIDRRNKTMLEEVARLGGEVAQLKGRIDGLPCAPRPGHRPATCE